MSRGGRKRRKWIWMGLSADPPWKVYYSPQELLGDGWMKVRRPCQCALPDYALLVPDMTSKGLRLHCRNCGATKDTGITVAVADEKALKSGKDVVKTAAEAKTDV